jgi:hypothetical protein
MKHGPIQLLAPVGLLSLALALSSCGSTSMGLHTREALGELDGANYQRAHFEVDKALKLEPDSPALQRLWRQTRVLSLLDKARERIFEDKEELALALLEQVLVLDSSNAIAIRWRDKARQQLGVKRLFEGQESLGRGELEQALAMFREAMQLVPGNEAAERGYRDVGRIFSERRLNAEEHYQEALRAQLDGDWYRVLYHAGISANEDPSRQDAKQLLAAGQRQVAEAARLEALSYEEERDYGAASRRYARAAQLAGALDLSWRKAAEERLELMSQEFEAEQLVDRAELLIAAGDFAQARELIADAESKTQLQKLRINTAKLELIAAERQNRMQRARLLEADHRFDAALAIYVELDAQRQDEEVTARKQRIDELLANCAELYASAEKLIAEGKREEAMSELRQILALHRRYKDVQVRLEQLQSADAS